MPGSRKSLPGTPKRIGVAADHGGFELKEFLVGMLRGAHYELVGTI
jgi:ribose 5-phosphate isomerase RpiB